MTPSKIQPCATVFSLVSLVSILLISLSLRKRVSIFNSSSLLIFFFGWESIGLSSASLLTGAIAECSREVIWKEIVSSNRKHSSLMFSFENCQYHEEIEKHHNIERF